MSNGIFYWTEKRFSKKKTLITRRQSEKSTILCKLLDAIFTLSIGSETFFRTKYTSKSNKKISSRELIITLKCWIQQFAPNLLTIHYFRLPNRDIEIDKNLLKKKAERMSEIVPMENPVSLNILWVR